MMYVPPSAGDCAILSSRGGGTHQNPSTSVCASTTVPSEFCFVLSVLRVCQFWHAPRPFTVALYRTGVNPGHYEALIIQGQRQRYRVKFCLID